jgi:hypothetical protein
MVTMHFRTDSGKGQRQDGLILIPSPSEVDILSRRLPIKWLKTSDAGILSDNVIPSGAGIPSGDVIPSGA